MSGSFAYPSKSSLHSCVPSAVANQRQMPIKTLFLESCSMFYSITYEHRQSHHRPTSVLYDRLTEMIIILIWYDSLLLIMTANWSIRYVNLTSDHNWPPSYDTAIWFFMNIAHLQSNKSLFLICTYCYFFMVTYPFNLFSIGCWLMKTFS